MSYEKFSTDCVQLVLQGLLGRKVSIDEVIFFIKSKKYGIIDYDEMRQRVWEQFHTGDVPLQLIPLEVMLFRMNEHCITPKSKLEDCLWLDISNLEVYIDEINELLKDSGINNLEVYIDEINELLKNNGIKEKKPPKPNKKLNRIEVFGKDKKYGR